MVFLKKRDFLSFLKASEDIKKEISQLKEESNEHLDTINENTNEIQANYSYLLDLENKINKLDDKLNEIAIILRHLVKKQTSTDDKKEIFIIKKS